MTKAEIIPQAFHPTLQFRYFVEFLDYNTKIPNVSGYEMDNPKWTIKDGWSNPISLRLYRFELVKSIEETLIEISRNPLNRKLRINILQPGEIIDGYWDITGNIEFIDYGTMTWKNDDILSVSLTILPSNCQYTNLQK